MKIYQRNYVKTIYQIFDDNDNSLYITSVTNNNHIYFSNRVIIYENIFYNFKKNVKKIKFVIKFQMILSIQIMAKGKVSNGTQTVKCDLEHEILFHEQTLISLQ